MWNNLTKTKCYITAVAILNIALDITNHYTKGYYNENSSLNSPTL